MSETSHPVGYGRPPEHTRFQKGQSGNPSGKPGPKTLAKQKFDAVVIAAVNSDEEGFREAKPGTMLESFARKIVLNAVDGRPSAQRLLLSILERERPRHREENNMHPEHVLENSRELLGDRYEEFRSRFDAAIAKGSLDDLADLAADFEDVGKSPAGNI
ncbi:MAG TPA: DUF5681 domain-containing protein [Rhizomicrobium sp.]|jgi:hypothetical protein|nr:DUF5681 domain-containing protein [Rhizomicrobium sp.]